MSKLSQLTMAYALSMAGLFCALAPVTSTAQVTSAEIHRKESKAIARTVREIEEQIDSYNKSPRKTFISPWTRELPYATYYEEVAKHIEALGTTEFPINQSGEKIYGRLYVAIPILHDGSLFMRDGGAKIVTSSGNAELDAAALDIVRRAAPFKPFQREAAEHGKVEVRVIVTSMDFKRAPTQAQPPGNAD